MNNARILSPGIVLFILLLRQIPATATDGDHEVICFEPDQKYEEIFLNCGSRGVIYITTSRYGYQELAQDRSLNETCRYQDHPGDCDTRPYESMLQHLKSRCLGTAYCTVNIEPVELTDCPAEYSNFFQVDYICIPDEPADQRMIVDICGEGLGTVVPPIIRTHGYIQSQNYPRDYRPLQSCTCNLTTTGHVLLDILDMNISPGANIRQATDWLEYTVRLEDWGNGIRLNDDKDTDQILIRSNTVFLNFYADFRKEARGFWIGYYGKSEDGERDKNISLQCFPYNPPEYKTSSTCFSSGHFGEMYMSCHSLGVINILSARHGYTHDTPCLPGLRTTGDACAVDDNSQVLDSIKNLCMGTTECLSPVSPLHLPACDRESNYIQVEYHCIEDAKDENNVVDICGEKLPSGMTIDRYNGYIQSLEYPSPYGPDANCTCLLHTLEDGSEVVLDLLDIDLADDGECEGDSVEYVRYTQHYQHVKLCGMAESGELHTRDNTVYLNFYSDGSTGKRGFWLKYRGAGPDDSRVKVNLQCRTNLPGIPPLPPPTSTLSSTTRSNSGETENEVTGGSPSPDNRQNDTTRTHHVGLIAGLSVAALLILVALVAMVIHKYRASGASAAKSPSGRYEDRVASTTPLGTRQTIRKYSAFSSFGQSPYAAFDNALPATRLPGRFSSGSGESSVSNSDQLSTVPEADYAPTNPSGASFTNKAFESEFEPHNNITL